MLTNHDINRLVASGAMSMPKLPTPPKPRKEYTFRPEIAAKHLSQEERIRRRNASKRATRQANLAKGLTRDGKVRQHKQSLQAKLQELVCGKVPFVEAVNNNIWHATASRMGVKVAFRNGKVYLKDKAPPRRWCLDGLDGPERLLRKRIDVSFEDGRMMQ